MRVDVKKFLFVGLSEVKNAFFEKAQHYGVIQFVDLAGNKKSAVSEEVHLYLDALKVLREQPKQMQDERKVDPLKIAKEIVSNKHELEKVEENIRVITLDISRIQIYGNFSLEDIDYIREHGGLYFQFLTAKRGCKDKIDDLIYIDSDHGLDYFVALNGSPKTYEGMIELKIDASLSQLKDRLDRARVEKREIELKLAQYARFSDLLHNELNKATNELNLQIAQDGTQPLLDNTLFTAIGWIPVNQLEKLTKITEELSVYATEVAIEPNDQVPTYLENSGMGKIGEDVIDIYDTPSTTDKDPSLWVLIAFILFFAFIVSDGGYGSVYLGLTLYLRYKYPNLKGSKKRLLNLATIISVACICWGLLTSTFFGVALDPEHSFRHFSLTTFLGEKKAEYHRALNDATYQRWLQEYPALESAQNSSDMIYQGYIIKKGQKVYELQSELADQALLELMLFVGIVHIIIGQLRYASKNYSLIGWAIFLVGAFLYFPMYLGAPTFLNYWFHLSIDRLGSIGLQLMLVGIPLAVGLAIIRLGILGITEIMNLIQVFADTLSYLRLYALGLSGSILSITINDMATSLPFIFAVILIALGHAVNMLLGIQGGVIHGLRLNFLEWYHYSFEGGGHKFKPLERKK